jgi:adenylosuccinate synthase
LQEIGQRLQSIGHEFGVTTGRPRRCGWLDIPVLRYTNVVNGYTAVALTKLDILDNFDEIDIGVEYVKDGEAIKYYPSSEQVEF